VKQKDHFLLGYQENEVEKKFDPPGSQNINKESDKINHTQST